MLRYHAPCKVMRDMRTRGAAHQRSDAHAGKKKVYIYIYIYEFLAKLVSHALFVTFEPIEPIESIHGTQLK